MNVLPEQVIVRNTIDGLTEFAITCIEKAAQQAVEERGEFLLGLSGGMTPVLLFRRMAEPTQRRRIPWTLTEVFWADERCVPPTHQDSNYGVAWGLLLSQAGLLPEQVHRIEGEDPEPVSAATRYAAVLPERFDLLYLGIGSDGHTASLFPGAPAVQETVRRAVAVLNAAKPPPCRITITPPVIAAARTLLVIATGAEKAPAVARALAGPWNPDDCPAQLARRGTWLLDAAAAAELPTEMRKR